MCYGNIMQFLDRQTADGGESDWFQMKADSEHELNVMRAALANVALNHLQSEIVKTQEY